MMDCRPQLDWLSPWEHKWPTTSVPLFLQRKLEGALLQCPLWIVKEKHSNFKSRSHLLRWHSSKHQHVDSIKLIWASLSTFMRYSDATHVGMFFESLFLSASVLTNRVRLREKNLAQLTNHCMVLPFVSFSWVRVNITQTTPKIQQQQPPQRWEAGSRILAAIGFVLSLLATGLLKHVDMIL